MEKDKNKEKRKGLVVGCGALNIRLKPSKESKVLSFLSKDETVNILSTVEDNKDWLKIRSMDGCTGYVMIKYIQEL